MLGQVIVYSNLGYFKEFLGKQYR